MANDRSKIFFNVLALENILVALTREIGDGPCFLYIEFSWIGVQTSSELILSQDLSVYCSVGHGRLAKKTNISDFG